MRCPSCKGAFPEGCSTCRPIGPKITPAVSVTPPMLTYTVGGIKYYPSLPIEAASGPAHTCPQCMRGLPCDPSSLSSLVGQIASRTVTTDDQWKRGAFRDQADGIWDANGSPVDTYPQETQ